MAIFKLNQMIYIIVISIIDMQDFKKLLRRIPLDYKEYYFPKTNCCLFLMPDGRLFGNNGYMQHSPMVQKIIGRKISDKECMCLLVQSKIGRVVIYKRLLFDIVFDPSNDQIQTLKDLIKYGNYVETVIGTFPEMVPDSPSENQICKILGLSTKPLSQTPHGYANIHGYSIPKHRLI